MSHSELYYFVFATAALWFVLARLAGLFVRANRLPPVVATALGVGAGVAMLFPMGGFTLWQWLYSAHANPSVTLFAMVSLGLYRALTGRRALGARNWRLLCGGSVALGLILYTPLFIAPHYDAYAWDWEKRWLTLGTMGLASALLFRRNPLGLVLLGALAAHLGNALESDNLWDYLVDPFSWMIGLFVILKKTIGRLFQGLFGPRAMTPAPVYTTPVSELPGAVKSEAA